MNQLSNLNATVVKELNYSAAIDASVTTLNLTVENCHTNAFIEKIVFNFATADATFVNQVTVQILDRGNGYTGSINGVLPTTFASFGAGQSVQGGTLISPILTQQSSTVAVAYVNQSVQDAEGLGNIYVKLTRANAGVFNVSFKMTVFYKPEITYNPSFNNRNQISYDKPMRVISQTGTGTYIGAGYTDQTNFVAQHYNARNNSNVVQFGFNLNTTDPVFYFGTPYKTRRWFLGFSSDNNIQIGLVTFSYFDGNNFVAFASTQVYNGAAGPGTYKFSQDGVVIFVPPTSWFPVQITDDPLTLYNKRINDLAPISTNNMVYNPPMYWIRCNAGVVSGTLRLATVVPLIDPEEPLTTRRRKI